MLPKTVIYDPALTLGLPVAVSITSGMNAIAHAEVHTVVLPQALAFNAPAVPEAMHRIERALGVQGSKSAPAAVFDLARDHDAPTALRDIGMKAADLDRAADIAVQNPYWNPRLIGQAERGAIRELLQAAYEGRRPD